MEQLLVVMVVVAAVGGVGVGWLLSRRRPPPDLHGPGLRRLASELSAGRRPTRGETSPEVRAILDGLERAWVPRNEERQRSLEEALGRIAAFLRDQLRRPLEDGLRRGTLPALRDGSERALGGLDDLEFFLRQPLTPDEVHNLVPLVQQVTREFTADWEITVRMSADDKPVRAHIHRDTFLDAVYLLLHNAGQFGKGAAVDVSVANRSGKALVAIRDHGPGFTPEALERAHDLFYTTSPTSLGLGIPFARKIIESFGGEIRLQNLDDGGAQVELALPAA
jgi:signal transduction histidine kinase